jgi:alcohol dehydrogenase class IV
MVRFDHFTNQRIVFGRGVARQAAEIAAGLGQRVFLVTGGNSERHAWLEAALGAPAVYRATGEPAIDQAREAARLAKERDCDVVVACGGGSALDLGKAAAALAANPGDVMDYIEVVGRGEPLVCPALPVVALPATAGTGSEATRNAVLHDEAGRVKASLRHDSMVPAVALVDPELTLTVPPAVTAATGLDALTQLIEPFVSVKSKTWTDTLCAEGIHLAAEALPRLFRDGSDMEARTMMSLASLFGGIALANAGLGAVHGLAAPIGGMFGAPHGAVCAALLPHVIAANRAALAQDHPAQARYRLIGEWVDLNALIRQAGIPGLRRYGIGEQHFQEIALKAAGASSMKANPAQLSLDAIVEILRGSL